MAFTTWRREPCAYLSGVRVLDLAVFAAARK